VVAELLHFADAFDGAARNAPAKEYRMPRFVKNLRGAAVVAIVATCLAASAACDSTNNPNPTSPTNPNPTPSPSASAPHIDAIAPSSPVVDSSLQTITITGAQFASGLTILLDAPNGVWTTYKADSITVQSDSRFTAKVKLDQAGRWDITVHSADGAESNEVPFTVAAAQ
jgi:hypothetical protein